jgi:CheY-like chemotaxis protein
VPPSRTPPPKDGGRIVICDYNQLLQSVTGLLRMSGYTVFQAYDGLAAEELCAQLEDIKLLVLNTFGTGIDVGELIQVVRRRHPDMPVLHIGNSVPDGLPTDIPTLAEDFTSDTLLLSVKALIGEESTDLG